MHDDVAGMFGGRYVWRTIRHCKTTPTLYISEGTAHKTLLQVDDRSTKENRREMGHHRLDVGLNTSTQQPGWCRPHVQAHLRSRARPCALPSGIIDAARKDLREYCQLIDGDQQEACWHAYDYLSEQQAVRNDMSNLNRHACHHTRRHNTTSRLATTPHAWNGCRPLCGSS